LRNYLPHWGGGKKSFRGEAYEGGWVGRERNVKNGVGRKRNVKRGWGI